MAETPRPDAIVLAAGAAQRMGRPKALLRVSGELFVGHAVRVLREGGCREVYVVAGADPAVHAAVTATGARLLVNPDPTSEQFDSVLIGMRALPADSTAVAVLPVDCPLVTTATVQALVAAAVKSTRPVILPMYNGVGGHPVLVRRQFYETVLTARGAEGLSGLIIDHGHQVELLAVTDPGILVDIDTPQEFERLIGPMQSDDEDSGAAPASSSTSDA